MNDNKKKYLILGCGKTGLSCARFLLEVGHDVDVFDTRKTPPCLNEMKRVLTDEYIYLEEWDPSLLLGKDAVIVSPGVSLNESVLQQAKEMGIRTLGDIELFYQHVTVPIVAITGSNGKSTVTAMLAEMALASNMNVAVGGNFGTPALDLIADVDFYILEVSSFQLEHVKEFSPAISVILNISPDHLDRYASLSDYRATKEKIYNGDGIRIINKGIVEFLPYMNANSRYFSDKSPVIDEYGLEEKPDGLWVVRGEEQIVHADEIPLSGKHNLINTAAAFSIGESMGLSVDIMRQAIRQFHGLPHRVEHVLEKNSVVWIDDSKGTNVGAAEAAVRGLSGRVILIAGGLAKENDFSLLVDAMHCQGLVVILIGQDAPLLGKAFCGVVPVVYADDMMDAVNIAARYAEPGDSVLLSPACASFDMYENYIERGNAFKAAVLHQSSQSTVVA